MTPPAPREAVWRRWLDFTLMLVGLDEFANFQKRPAGTPAVQLDAVAARRPEQVNVGAPPDRGALVAPVALERGAVPLKLSPPGD